MSQARDCPAPLDWQKAAAVRAICIHHGRACMRGVRPAGRDTVTTPPASGRRAFGNEHGVAVQSNPALVMRPADRAMVLKEIEVGEARTHMRIAVENRCRADCVNQVRIGSCRYQRVVPSEAAAFTSAPSWIKRRRACRPICGSCGSDIRVCAPSTATRIRTKNSRSDAKQHPEGAGSEPLHAVNLRKIAIERTERQMTGLASDFNHQAV
jgi:hypothetical protein